MATPPHKPTGPAGTPPRPLAAKAPPPDSGDEAAVEQLAASELDELTHAEFRLLYDEAARNILFAKRQQWHMLEYFTLLALALVGLGIAMPFASDVAHFVAGFLSFVALITLIVLMMLQNWQGSEHAKILYIVHDFANFTRSARRRKSRVTSDIHRYFMLAAMMIYVVILDVVVFRLFADLGK
ncbi:hypothetical protein [Ferrovibrio xuzhouensis]|uniref:Uncharacterized protein n=1 Tax=Ferrovibrio xuzhouensis TaxID=1576914 RepID=A0ABV7VEW6_9PROT